METISTTSVTHEPVNVLLVGNNPIEMGRVLDNLHQIRGKRIFTEIAFDLKSVLERLLRFKPTFIIIDDNIGNSELMLAVEALSKNKTTKDTPITVLKNSNYHQAPLSPTILDYLLKQNISAETLYTSIKHSLKLRRTRSFLYEAYQQRKKELLKLMH